MMRRFVFLLLSVGVPGARGSSPAPKAKLIGHFCIDFSELRAVSEIVLKRKEGELTKLFEAENRLFWKRQCIKELTKDSMLLVTAAGCVEAFVYPFQGAEISTRCGTVRLQEAQMMIGKFNVDFSAVVGHDNDDVEAVQKQEGASGIPVDLWARGPFDGRSAEEGTSAEVEFSKATWLLVRARCERPAMNPLGGSWSVAWRTKYGTITFTRVEGRESKVEEDEELKKKDGESKKKDEKPTEEDEESSKMDEESKKKGEESKKKGGGLWFLFVVGLIVLLVLLVAGVARVLLVGWFCCRREQAVAGSESLVELQTNNSAEE